MEREQPGSGEKHHVWTLSVVQADSLFAENILFFFVITKVISVVHGVKSLNSEGSWMIRCGNSKIDRKKRKEGKQMVPEDSLMFIFTEKKRAHFSFLLLFLSPAHISSMHGS